MSERELQKLLRRRTMSALQSAVFAKIPPNAAVGIITTISIESVRHWIGHQIHDGGNPIDSLEAGRKVMDEHSHYLCDRFVTYLFPEPEA